MNECLDCLVCKPPKHTPVVEGTLWCQKHQVQPPTVLSWDIRHGYYVPAQNLLRGDRQNALAAQLFYREALGLDSTYAEPYDGVSIHVQADGKPTIRVALQNFFTNILDVKVHDYSVEDIFGDKKT